MLMHLREMLRSKLGQRLAVAMISSGAIWAVGTLATFLVGMLLARSLGPAGYGVYGTAIAIVTLLAVPAQLGLPLLATREVSKARARGAGREVLPLGRWFVAAVAVASIALAAALRLAAAKLPLSPQLTLALAGSAWLLPPLALSALGAGLLRGQERVVTSQLLDVLIRPFAFVAALLACAWPLGVAAAIGAQTLAAATIALLALALFFQRVPGGGTSGTRPLRAWAGAALPMTLLEALRALEGSYGVLVASYVAGTADAGLLRVALASSVLVSAPISLQNIVVAPFIASAHAADAPGRLNRIVAGSTIFMTVAVGAATLAVAGVADWALPFAFGAGFAGAYWPLVILCGNQLLAAALGPGVILLGMTGQERTVARAFGWSVLAGIATGLLLTPLFGAIGTAASTIVITAVRAAMLNRVARRTLGITPSLLGAAALRGGGAWHARRR